MKRRTRAFAFVAVLAASSTSASAAKLPAIKAGDENKVPACATPGRMQAYLKSRNSSLDGRFDRVATEYMRHGEEYGIRWDYAFFQMIVETASLSFKRGNGKWGDVKPKQNNFAGLGATGGGEPGESFNDVTTGVRAHVEHIVMYSGARVDNPTADRTRKVQEWGVLTSWQKKFRDRPITFSDLTKKWSPGDGSYAASIESVADKFFEDFCQKPDPHPELVAEARKGRAGAETKVAAVDEKPERVSGAELARKAVEMARGEGDGARRSLGAATLAKAAEATHSAAKAEPNRSPETPKVTVLNGGRGDDGAAAAAKDKPASVQMASAAQTARAAVAPQQKAAAAKKPAKCNVYTASYGGQKAIIIKALAGDAVNYTVLDVNDGAEKREAEAYIAAYAKGGEAIGEFGSQAVALDKAFELCPEG